MKDKQRKRKSVDFYLQDEVIFEYTSRINFSQFVKQKLAEAYIQELLLKGKHKNEK